MKFQEDISMPPPPPPPPTHTHGQAETNMLTTFSKLWGIMTIMWIFVWSGLSLIDPTLIKAFGCVIELLCLKISAAVNDVKTYSFWLTSYGLLVLQFNRESDN